jgi:hypothetical protein
MRSPFHSLPILKTHFPNTHISNYLTLKPIPGITILILLFNFSLSIRHILIVFTRMLYAPPWIFILAKRPAHHNAKRLIVLILYCFDHRHPLSVEVKNEKRISLISLYHCMTCYEENLNFTTSLSSRVTSECTNFCNWILKKSKFSCWEAPGRLRGMYSKPG